MLSIQKNKKHLDFFGKVYYNVGESRGKSAFSAGFCGLECICLNACYKRNVSFLCSLLIKMLRSQQEGLGDSSRTEKVTRSNFL